MRASSFSASNALLQPIDGESHRTRRFSDIAPVVRPTIRCIWICLVNTQLTSSGKCWQDQAAHPDSRRLLLWARGQRPATTILPKVGCSTSCIRDRPRSQQPPLGAVKAVYGHLLGGAGVVNVAATALDAPLPDPCADSRLPRPRSAMRSRSCRGWSAGRGPTRRRLAVFRCRQPILSCRPGRLRVSPMRSQPFVAPDVDTLVRTLVPAGTHVHCAITPARPNALIYALARVFEGQRTLTVSIASVHSSAHALALSGAVETMITCFRPHLSSTATLRALPRRRARRSVRRAPVVTAEPCAKTHGRCAGTSVRGDATP